MGRFNKPVQKGTVVDYIAEFEELRGYVFTHQHVQTPEFYLSSFQSGLREDIQQALYVYNCDEVYSINPSAPYFAPSQQSTSTLPEIKKKLPQEMAKRREKVLCYNCDEVYSRGHKYQRPQLYLLVGDDDDEPETEVSLDEEPEAEVSIHALHGTQGLHTLKLKGMITKVPFTMLVDTGSTHNFISQSLVKTLGLHTSTCTTMKVTLADE